MDGPISDATRVLGELTGGDAAAAGKLMPLVYDELRGLAAHYLHRERIDHTLQPTALVHEAYVRLVDQTRADWRNKNQFFAVAGQVMRRVLVDHARGKKAAKRGGEWGRVSLDGVAVADDQTGFDVVAVHEAIDRLAELDPRQGRIVEMRFFGGMKEEEIADVLGVSLRTVEGDWRMARAWLRREMSKEDAP